MAFIGMFAIIIAVVVISVIASVVPFIIGTYLFKKTRYKKTGIALRIIGYVTFIPVLAISVVIFAMLRS